MRQWQSQGVTQTSEPAAPFPLPTPLPLTPPWNSLGGNEPRAPGASQVAAREQKPSSPSATTGGGRGTHGEGPAPNPPGSGIERPMGSASQGSALQPNASPLPIQSSPWTPQGSQWIGTLPTSPCELWTQAAFPPPGYSTLLRGPCQPPRGTARLPSIPGLSAFDLPHSQGKPTSSRKAAWGGSLNPNWPPLAL